MKTEFEAGNIVVKRGKSGGFNQVDPDHSQEWLNGIGKKCGDIVGITKTPSALSRWVLSYNLRSHISSETRQTYQQDLDDLCKNKESNKARAKKDKRDEEAILSTLKSFKAFSDESPNELQNIANKDLANHQIEDDLLNAPEKGQDQVYRFVEERLLPREQNVKFHDPIPKIWAHTFASLYEVDKKKESARGKKRTIKADRKILLRMLSAYQAGRPVDLTTISKHELINQPPSLAMLNGNLRSGSKSLLLKGLAEHIECPCVLDESALSNNPTLIIDGQALICEIGKPKGAVMFGHVAGAFNNAFKKVEASRGWI